jgi:glycosyltransferase involved in cell wall biosynthesis
LIFVGHFGDFHNIDAAVYLVREILPLVQREIPDCTVQLVGASPAATVRQLAEENEAVSVTGFVPDLNAYLNEAAVFVAPLRFAAGVQNKALEAMAAGTPVVTSSLVNKGLSATEERDLLLADTPADFARQIIRLLRAPALQEKLSRAGRAFVCRQYNWEYVLARMQTVAQQLG